jgi:hypothetical protein
MSEFPKIHIDTVANGDFIHLRTDSGEEMLEVVSGLAQHYGEIAERLGDIKQAALARGVFSGDASNPSQSTGAGAKKGATTSSKPVTAPDGGAPVCEHGPMKDMAGKRNKRGEPYKNRYYCTKWGSDCKPVGDWVEK